jgi:Rad3-related DNA helicase
METVPGTGNVPVEGDPHAQAAPPVRAGVVQGEQFPAHAEHGHLVAPHLQGETSAVGRQVLQGTDLDPDPLVHGLECAPGAGDYRGPHLAVAALYPATVLPRFDSPPPAFVVPWATGPDPALDGVFRVLALRPEAEGWGAFDAWSQPFEPGSETASARMTREFGVSGADLADARPPGEVWSQLEVFLGQAPVVTPDGEVFDAWAEALGGRPRVTVGLCELASLLLPGRLATRREGLVRALLAEHSGPPAALFPHELVLALGELVRRGLDRDPRVLAVAAGGYAGAHHMLCASDPAAAERLAFALDLIDRPSRWAQSTGELFTPGDGLRDGALSNLSGDLSPGARLDELQPAVSAAFADWGEAEELPPDAEGPAPFHADDFATLEGIFARHLPEALATEFGGPAADYQRPSQVAVARAVAGTLGADELLLVHAPTGTGKTLAYLVPALLWARRHGVRVGIATYTRALQEQAMDSEVPRALAALGRAGIGGPTRVSVLKGRENYLCFRALRTLAPEEDEDAEGWLAWTQLALFALTDREGDLDRLPRQPPVRLTSSADYRRRLNAALAGARARTGCCSHAQDRGTCAAELARRRAERSHVVLTNQSFALARREFFRHMIFDECEHLHDVAGTAWSHALSPRRVRDLLRRLHAPKAGGRSRAPLDRLRAQLMPSTFAGDETDRAIERCRDVAQDLQTLETAARGFESWRAGARRADDEQHQLLREYLEHERGAPLVDARQVLGRTLGGLESNLARLLEAIENASLRGAPRLRRTLDLARADLVTVVDELGAWMPMDEGVPRLARSTFYDVERDGGGELLLRASVLLPNEVLGRDYLPELGSATFLSATTKLSGSFDAARGYLGLDRAEQPAEDEDRAPRRVRTAEAPEAFDYSRVLIGLPRDLPEPRDKQGHLASIERFVDWLAERTRGRILVLFTSLADVKRVGAALAPRFRARRTPLWYQGMPEASKEELSSLFRGRVDSVLLGVDTFWFGADFPGETLEYLVIARLPYGVPDRYHHAQRAALGSAEQRKRIYMPRALAKFRQGFGRLMRRTTDRGCVFVLDRRLSDPRHRVFLRELPIATFEEQDGARLVRGDMTHVLREGLAHMGMLADLERRGLSPDFEVRVDSAPTPEPAQDPPLALPEPPPKLDISVEDLPF